MLRFEVHTRIYEYEVQDRNRNQITASGHRQQSRVVCIIRSISYIPGYWVRGLGARRCDIPWTDFDNLITAVAATYIRRYDPAAVLLCSTAEQDKCQCGR